jgi:hypothetical protein
MPHPRLTFACELKEDALQALFADPAVIDDLVALQASVSLGIIDLSPGRAAVVRHLNEAGVPVIAWQLLPREQGYWFNADNATQAAARYAAFKAWTVEHGLRWAGLGVDIEPDVNELELLLTRQRMQLVPRLLRRAFDQERVRRAQAAYNALLAQMRADGYPVESYQIPLIVDERQAGSTLLQRLSGIVDIQADREVLMLYTSFLGRWGPGVLWSYAPQAQAIGVGSTGGGVEAGDTFPVCTWDDLCRDLRLARQASDNLFIFSLEGCLRQGLLGQLRGFDWDGPVTLPSETARKVDGFRRTLRTSLWASAHPALALGGLIGLVWLLSRLRPRPRPTQR